MWLTWWTKDILKVEDEIGGSRLLKTTRRDNNTLNLNLKDDMNLIPAEETNCIIFITNFWQLNLCYKIP